MNSNSTELLAVPQASSLVWPAVRASTAVADTETINDMNNKLSLNGSQTRLASNGSLSAASFSLSDGSLVSNRSTRICRINESGSVTEEGSGGSEQLPLTDTAYLWAAVGPLGDGILFIDSTGDVYTRTSLVAGETLLGPSEFVGANSIDMISDQVVVVSCETQMGLGYLLGDRLVTLRLEPNPSESIALLNNLNGHSWTNGKSYGFTDVRFGSVEAPIGDSVVPAASPTDPITDPETGTPPAVIVSYVAVALLLVAAVILIIVL